MAETPAPDRGHRGPDWTQYAALKAAGLSDRAIARRWNVPWTTFYRARQRFTQDHPGTPTPEPTAVYQGTPARRHTRVHPSTPQPAAPQPIVVHPGTPLPDEAATRLLALLPELEALVARERDRQRLLRTPIGTPRHTVKKTYVVDTLYVDLIARVAQAEGLELKDVVNLALHECFARRGWLPEG